MPAATVEEAFAYCEARAKAHYENFPVGLFVPRAKRRYVHALYTFARAADDFADEPIYEGVRQEKLDQWEALTDAAYRGEAEGPIFVALAETVRRLGIPKELLLDLLSAFRQDTEKTRYASWEELLDYCRRSANPVGRLVLLVFDQKDPDLPALSDAICTGPPAREPLAGRGDRLRPGPDLRARGPHAPPRGRHVGLQHRPGERRLARDDGGADRPDPRPLRAAGRPLCDRVGRELRFEMRLTWLGGNSILDRIEATGGDVFRRRPQHGPLDKAALAWRAWRWPSRMSASVGARLTRQSGTNFYYAFRILPEEKRRAIYALYAFCRVVDDCVDEEGGEGEEGLRRWLAEVHRAYAGRPETELGRELAETVARFPIPRGAFEDIVAGCRMDLTTRRYATFADLRVYCERVASAVGLASIEIFGYDDPRTRDYAVELGLALQLTNILRDVAADAARDRLYLPLEDLARFGVTEEELLAAARGPRRAPRGRPRPAPRLRGGPGPVALRGRGLAAARGATAGRCCAAEIMGAIYREVLEEWARRGHPIGGARVQLGKPRKIWIALRTITRVRWGR